MRGFGPRFALLSGLLLSVFSLSATVASADTVALTLNATVGANGTTIFVSAPGCQTSPPGASEIFIQGRDATTGEVGEGAVAVGGFTAPGEGSALIPAGTPISSFLVSVSCNGGTRTGSQAFVIGPAAAPVSAQPSLTG